MLSMANVMAADIPDLAFWNFSIAQERMNDDIQVYLNQIKETRTISDLNEILTQAAAHFPHRVELESRILDSLATLDQEIEQKAAWRPVEELKATLQSLGEAALRLLRKHLEARCEQLNISPEKLQMGELPRRDERIPRRKTEVFGAITLDTLPLEMWTSPVKTSPKNNLPFILSWWLADGKRTIAEIENELTTELRGYRECIPAWFNFLEKNGYIEFVHPQPEAVGTIAQEDKPEKSENEADNPE